jgi:hypothetical protein
MKKPPPRRSRPHGLLASPRVVRLAALAAEHYVSQVPDIAHRARRKWRRAKPRVKRVFRWLLLILFLNSIGWCIASRL